MTDYEFSMWYSQIVIQLKERFTVKMGTGGVLDFEAIKRCVEPHWINSQTNKTINLNFTKGDNIFKWILQYLFKNLNLKLVNCTAPRILEPKKNTYLLLTTIKNKKKSVAIHTYSFVS